MQLQKEINLLIDKKRRYGGSDHIHSILKMGTEILAFFIVEPLKETKKNALLESKTRPMNGAPSTIKFQQVSWSISSSYLLHQI